MCRARLKKVGVDRKALFVRIFFPDGRLKIYSKSHGSTRNLAESSFFFVCVGRLSGLSQPSVSAIRRQAPFDWEGLGG
jgi:hypothetical protein